MLPFQTLPFDYLGGYQTAKPLTKYAVDDALIAIGGHFDKRGAFEKRQGGIKYNQGSLDQGGNGIFDFRYNNNQSQKLILFGQNRVWEGNAGNPIPILTGQADSRYSAVKFNIAGKDFVFWGNGVNPFTKYDGTTVTSGSIAAPVAAPVATPVAGAGTLGLGTYRIAVTFLTADDEESNPSPEVLVTLAGAEDTIDLSAIPVSANPEVTARRVYMSLVGGSLLFGNVDIPDNVSTTFSILAPSEGALAEYDHDEAPIAQFIKTFNNRLAAAGDPSAPDVLYLSKEFDVWYWPQGIGSSVDYRIKIGNGDPITGIKDFQDVLIVSTDFDAWVVSGAPEDGSLTVTKIKSDERSGVISHWTMEVIEGWCWYVGRNSVYRTNGFEIQDVGWALSGFFAQLNLGGATSRFQINQNLLRNAVGVAVKSKPHNWYVFSTATAFGENNSTTFVIDYSTLRPDTNSPGTRIKVDFAVWPGFVNQASAIVINNNAEEWYTFDDYGFVFIMNKIDGDGSQVTSFVTDATGTVISDDTQSFTENMLEGLFVTAISGTGAEQTRRIIGNNIIDFEVDTPFVPQLDTTTRYAIGGIEFDYCHRWDNYGDGNKSKRWRYVRPRFETGGNFPISLIYGFDFLIEENVSETLELQGSSLWDVGLWDMAFWDISEVVDRLLGLTGDKIHRWSYFRVRNLGSGEPFLLASFDKIWQLKGMRR
jgi:hypothetical protein